MLLQYAWKAFCRRKTRSFMFVMGVALATALLVAVLSISNSVKSAVASSLGAAGADMIIQHRTKACPFSEVKLPLYLAGIDESVVQKLAACPDVKDVSGILEIWAFYGGHPTVVAGIDPAKKALGPVRVQDSTEKKDEKCCAITKGRYLVPNDDLHAMITDDFKAKTGYSIGDMIHLGPTEKFEVVAHVDMTGAARVAGAEAFIPLKTAQDMLGQGPIVDTIFVAVKNSRRTHDVAALAKQLIGPDVAVTTTENVDAATGLLAAVTLKALLGVSILILSFVALFLIRNAIENVVERIAEVGLMKAMGWRNRDISRLFVAETIYASVIGGIAGSVLGWVIAFVYSHYADLKLPQALNSSPACRATAPPAALSLSTHPSSWIFLIGIGAAVLVGGLAGLVASRRAASLDPVVALRRL
jgi:ABC-type lipoprotein release transport system permease subunit